MKGPPTNVSRPSIDRDAASRLIAPLTALVARAGSAILKVDRGNMRVDDKTDGSPVTEADLAADRIIADGLRQLTPDIPVLSEERAKPVAGCPEAFFLVDPLDGTKEFVAGRDEFTVNIALVVGGTPLLGIIGAPALGLIWRGLVGQGAERLASGPERDRWQEGGAALPIRTRPFPSPGQPWVAATSRSHGDCMCWISYCRSSGTSCTQLRGCGLALGKQADKFVLFFDSCRRKGNVIDYTGRQVPPLPSGSVGCMPDLPTAWQ